jgi:hypothetical protein
MPRHIHHAPLCVCAAYVCVPNVLLTHIPSHHPSGSLRKTVMMSLTRNRSKSALYMEMYMSHYMLYVCICVYTHESHTHTHTHTHTHSHTHTQHTYIISVTKSRSRSAFCIYLVQCQKRPSTEVKET